MKATHVGQCQACGARHKLPGGVLAKHGYTVSHGWFEGVCIGSGRLPYEQSYDLIDESISLANDKKKDILEIMGSISGDKSQDSGWRDVYHPELSSRRLGSVYLWHYGTYEQAGSSEFMHVFTSGDVRATTNPGRIEDKIKDGNTRYLRHLESKVRKIINYIISQRARLSVWEPRELEAIS